MASNISSISQALAADNARTSDANTGCAAISGNESIAVAKRARLTLGLPTPPNSISPSLPPLPFRSAKQLDDIAGSPPSQVDSDIDLQDAMDHANSRDQPSHGLAEFADDPAMCEGLGSVSAVLLAKHHLADVLLERGPLAIRHMMNHLNSVVPGFSEIQPTKARRIVVAALENRAGGGLKGEVEFEKVGWGRWDAHVKGQVSKGHRIIYPIREGNTTDAKSAPAGALRIPHNTERRVSKSRRPSHNSWTADGSFLSRLEASERAHKDVTEHEADKMSIDGDEDDEPRQPPRGRYGSRSSVPVNYSDTDEEDWASMGAEALRKASYSSSASRSAIHTHMRMALNRRPSAFTAHAMSAPGGMAIIQHARQQQRKSSDHDSKPVDFTGVDVDPQEREAIQALLKMGSA